MKNPGHVAQLDGGYPYYYEILVSNHRRLNVSLPRDDMDNPPIGMIASFDGAHFLSTDEEITNITSFRCLLFSRRSSENGITNSQSRSILTWQQVVRKEDDVTVFRALGTHCHDKLKLLLQVRESGKNLNMFDMHDGKILYMLTGHSLWNRKHFPFLFCTCSRSDGVHNHSNHVFTLISHHEHHHLYNRSKN